MYIYAELEDDKIVVHLDKNLPIQWWKNVFRFEEIQLKIEHIFLHSL